MTFDRFRFCKGNIGGTPRNKEETPKGRSNRFFYPPPCRVPWHYGVSCNNRREMHKTILMPKHKMPLSILSPCVSVREYRGSARRARGLNTIVEQKYETPPPVVSRNITGYRLAIGGKNKHVTQESIILLPAVSRSITGCFATQNIGEVSAGLENAGSGGDRVRFPLPLLIVNETGGNARKVKGLASTT